MPDKHDIPYLLQLLDDESADIRKSVVSKLQEYGDALPELITDAEPPTTASGQQALDRLVAKAKGEADVAVMKAPRKFRPGQLVKHKRYGYRGVIVSFDLSCQADESWYKSNRTQPDLDQPWYHVLVHDSQAATYAAQTSLEADDSIVPINHPLIEHFFTDLSKNGYDRNKRPWPFS